MVDAFGSQRLNVKPPQRGVFALDHDKECQPMMKIYLECIKKNGGDHVKCRDLSKEYLKCRMSNGLMMEEDLNNLGFSSSLKEVPRQEDNMEKETKGFIGGVTVKTKNKWIFW